MKLSSIFVLSIIFFSPFVAAQEGMSYAWDALRPVSDFALQLDAPIKWFVFLLALGILGISLLGHFKSKSKRVLIISFAFFLFALKAFFKVVDIYFSPGHFFSAAATDAADFLIMLSIFVAIFYKRKGTKFFDRDAGK